MHIYQIIKRNGSAVAYDSQKIKTALWKAIDAYNVSMHTQFTAEQTVRYQSIVDNIENSVKRTIRLSSNPAINIESIQDYVVDALLAFKSKDDMEAYTVRKIALVYTRYRERRAMQRKTEEVNAIDLIDEYLNKAHPNNDMAVHENSSTSFSLQGLHNHIFGAISEKKWLSYYSDEIQDVYKRGRIHIHDLSFLSSYCSGWDLKQLLEEGFTGVPEKTSSGPAKHLSTALGQIANFIYTLQGEFAGAQAFSNFNTLLAPFVRIDELTSKQVKQSIQEFIYNMNIPTRVGFQAPFSNLTLDLDVTKTVFADEGVIIGGKMQTPTYKEYQKEATMIAQAVIDVLEEGDAKQAMFPYPIVTLNVTKDFPWDNKLGESILRVTAKQGSFYFANFINSDFTENQIRSMCLTADTRLIVQKKDSNRKEYATIGNMIDNYDKNDWTILTPLGMKPIKRYIKIKEEDVIKVTYSSGKSLSMSKNHPHLITVGKKIKICLAKDLKVGMKTSVYVDPKISRGEAISKAKIKQFKEHPEKIRRGIYSSYFGKKHTIEARNKISDALKGHRVTDNCKNLSRDRWLGLNNPTCKQKYWDRKNISDNNQQISSHEKCILEFLENKETQFCFQKVFECQEKSKVYVADFYIPEKNLIIEVESKCDNSSYFNLYTRFVDREKFDFYRSLNINVLVLDPEKNDDWISYVNSTEEIISIENLKYDGFLYDIEILNDSERNTTNKFYANDILTHNCCRLRLNMKDIDEFTKGNDYSGGLDTEDYGKRINSGSIFSKQSLTGSIGVVTLNMAALMFDAIQTKPENLTCDFMKLVRKHMDLAIEALQKKRKIIESMANDGLYPYTAYYLRHVKARTGRYFSQHFSTICPNAVHEALFLYRQYIGEKENPGIVDNVGRDMAKEIIEAMGSYCIELQKQHKVLVNLEQAPAESAGVKMCKKSGIDPRGTGYYTNSTWIPAEQEIDLFDLINHQATISTSYSGGSALHLYNDTDLVPVSKELKKIILYAFTNTKLPYMTISPIINICPEHGRKPGRIDKCPICGKKTEIWVRCVGYYRPISGINTGRKKEHMRRKYTRIGTQTTEVSNVG